MVIDLVFHLQTCTQQMILPETITAYMISYILVDWLTCSLLAIAAIHINQSVLVYKCLSSIGIPYCNTGIYVL